MASLTSKLLAMASKMAMIQPHRMGSSWTFYFLSYYVCLTLFLEGTCFNSVSAAELCPFPAVPYAASYSNLTGGPTASKWSVQYNCDKDYEIFGEKTRHCVDGKWKGDLPICAVNVAIHKPASASSVANGGRPENAVDNKKSTVHEGKKCTETKSEKSPWWTVDLLEAVPVQYVRLTTRCCDDLPLKNAEIRVGNSETPASNALCNWIPKALGNVIYFFKFYGRKLVKLSTFFQILQNLRYK